MFRFVFCFKDGIVRIWVVNIGCIEYVLSGYKSLIICVRWGGIG